MNKKVKLNKNLMITIFVIIAMGGLIICYNLTKTVVDVQGIKDEVQIELLSKLKNHRLDQDLFSFKYDGKIKDEMLAYRESNIDLSMLYKINTTLLKINPSTIEEFNELFLLDSKVKQWQLEILAHREKLPLSVTNLIYLDRLIKEKSSMKDIKKYAFAVNDMIQTLVRDSINPRNKNSIEDKIVMFEKGYNYINVEMKKEFLIASKSGDSKIIEDPEIMIMQKEILSQSPNAQ